MNRIKPIGYTEKHHILPKCFKLGGLSDKENIVVFTAREHFIAHLLLCRMFIAKKKQQMWLAIGAFTSFKRNRKLTSRQFDVARNASSFGKIGVKRSDEFRKSLSRTKKGKPGIPRTPETKEKLRIVNLGKVRGKQSPELVERRAKMTRGKRIGPQPKITCPHCGKVGGLNNMKRWHFENCKLIHINTVS